MKYEVTICCSSKCIKLLSVVFPTLLQFKVDHDKNMAKNGNKINLLLVIQPGVRKHTVMVISSSTYATSPHTIVNS